MDVCAWPIYCSNCKCVDFLIFFLEANEDYVGYGDVNRHCSVVFCCGCWTIVG